MGSRKNVWTFEEEQLLFSSHANMGSKWAAIANLIAGKDQSAIKNKFYSTLRRGHRKINSYITEVKRKSDQLRNKAFKTINDIFISKLIAVVDRSYEEKFEVKPAALTLATDIEKLLIEVACSEGKSYHGQEGQEGNFTREEELVQKILEFNKNCKKRKGKRNSMDMKRKKSEELEQSQIITDSKEAGVKLQQKSQQLSAVNQQPIQIKLSQPKGEFSSFLTMVRNQSSSTFVNNSFSTMSSIFRQCCESKQGVQEQNLIQSAANMTHSSCLREEKPPAWMYESGSSHLSFFKRQADYLIGPSPTPNDPYSPFTLSNLMKNKNITANNMFEDKISCNESDFDNSSIYQKDGLPIIAKPRTGEFLIKSADLLREINQEAPALTSSMKMENSINLSIDKMQFVNSGSFLSQYVFQLHNPPTTNHPKQ